MKILIAVDSYKGTLTSKEVAETIKNNLNYENIEFDIIAIADGGEGTVDSLCYATKGNLEKVSVQDAFGEYKESYFCISDEGDTAILEIALSSGLATMKHSELNPFKSTTYGLGESIKSALDRNVKKLVIGIGGSSTNDGGAGMLQALGVKFYDAKDNQIDTMTGYSIGLVERIDMSGIDTRINDVYIRIACDVTNPLLGKTGCTEIYSRQKGASNHMVDVLEKNMEHFNQIVINTIGKDYSEIPGVGAAGGLGYGLLAFLNADLLSGLDVVADATKLEERIQKADVVITGEGSFDYQSLSGKAPTRIARLARKHNKKVIGVFALSDIDECPEFFDQMFAVVPTVCSKEESLENPQECLIKLINSMKII
ncbi:MAG: Glycerate 2-kinase [Candidatus Izimaplasma bacterium HR2]|nr:MAG: Glycerate 2-kinase [Candidatus Izimaplasma bacterium HR2]